MSLYAFSNKITVESAEEWASKHEAHLEEKQRFMTNTFNDDPSSGFYWVECPCGCMLLTSRKDDPKR